MDLEEIQKAVSGAISAAISRAVGQPSRSTDAAGTSSRQSPSTSNPADDDQKVERKYVTIVYSYV